MTRPGSAAPRARRFAHLSSLRTRVVAWNTLILAALLGVLGAMLPFLVRSAMLASVDRDLVDRAGRFLAHPPPGSGLPPPGALAEGDFRPRPGPPPRPPGGPPEGPPPRPGDAVRDPGDDLRPRFSFLNTRMDPEASPLWDTSALASVAQGHAVYSTVTRSGEQLRVLSLPFPPGGPVIGVVQVPYSLAELNRAVAGLTRTLLLLAPLALLCAAIGGSLLTGRALRPVQQITQTAERIGADALHERLPTHGNDEFTHLAATFNGMLGRLQEDFTLREQLIARLRAMIEQQRRFTADASHELRTPLTAIKANSSLLLGSEAGVAEYREAMAEIDAAASAMSHLVQDLLLLARADSGDLGRHPIELPLAEPLREAVTRVRRPDRAAVTLRLEDESLTVAGVEDELTRLFTNLLENAARSTPPDGTITVTLCRAENAAVTTIADTGIGIAAEHLPHLGERFYRVDPARARADGGTGLGLSICRSIVAAHGGAMEFRSTPGEGTRVTVRLPLQGVGR